LLLAPAHRACASLFPVMERQAAGAVPVFQAELVRGPMTGEDKPGLEQLKDALAKRQARAAAALVRLGHAGEVWPRLRHSADPRLRSFLVNWLIPLGADPNTLAAELARLDLVRRGSVDPAETADRRSPATRADAESGRPSFLPVARSGGLATTRPGEGSSMDAILFHPETSTRRALILALGTDGSDGLSPGEQATLISRLLDLYEHDVDAGIHGAAEWALRQWQQSAKVDEIDAKL